MPSFSRVRDPCPLLWPAKAAAQDPGNLDPQPSIFVFILNPIFATSKSPPPFYRPNVYQTPQPQASFLSPLFGVWWRPGQIHFQPLMLDDRDHCGGGTLVVHDCSVTMVFIRSILKLSTHRYSLGLQIRRSTSPPFDSTN